MSGAGFHVHGPHDHELEHAAQGGHDSGGMIAQTTQANAGLYKNNAAIKKTEATKVIGVLALLHI